MSNEELIKYLREIPDILSEDLTEQEFDLYTEVIGKTICRLKSETEWRMMNCRRSDDRR